MYSMLRNNEVNRAKFKVSIVINGLDGQHQKHTIEEHLIEYYRRVLGGSLSNVADDPKDI